VERSETIVTIFSINGSYAIGTGMERSLPPKGMEIS